MEDAVSFRPITPEDEPLLLRIYASTRAEELSVVPWSDEQKAAFLEQQFSAQHKFYMDTFRNARFDLVLYRGEAIGRLYVDRRDDEIRLIDIALLPEHRRKGIGSALIKDLLAEAQGAGKPVRIHVERNNPALGLYERLGFLRIGDWGVYFLMEWTPQHGLAGKQSNSPHG